MKNTIRKTGKVLSYIAGIVLLVLLGYIIYLYVSYHRIPDNQELTVETISEEEKAGDQLTTGQKYSALTYNVGFGAYTPDFSFFMDGGKSSWAKSKESVKETIKGAGELVASRNPDFALLQEVDLNSTRSYHVDEYSVLKETIPAYDSVFAQNYDSAFLFYPFTQPHGKSRSGLALFSKYPVTDSRVPVDNGRELVVFELHMSAYGNSDAIREGQINMLAEDMAKEYDAGNYVICGGDFNHDLKASEDDSEDRESWAYPFPREKLPEHFGFCIDQLTEKEKASLWDSARNADMEYVPGETYTVTLDGFIISDNVECLSYEDIETGYSYSDHDPVYMEFKLH